MAGSALWACCKWLLVCGAFLWFAPPLCGACCKWLLVCAAIWLCGGALVYAVVDTSSSSRQHSPLSRAAYTGNAARVAELLERGADPSIGLVVGPFGLLGSVSPLSFASYSGQQTVAALLNAGADPNTGNDVGPFGMFLSVSPLQDASGKGHAKAAAALLEAGADPNTGLKVGVGVVGSGSPLTFASMAGHTEVVAVLLEAGADPNTGFLLGPFGLFGSFSPLWCTGRALRGRGRATEHIIADEKARPVHHRIVTWRPLVECCSEQNGANGSILT